MTNKSASVELTPLSNLMKIPAAASSTSSLFVQSPITSPLFVIGNLNRLNNKYNQQDSPLFNFTPRSDANQDPIEKKLFIVS